ncbi:MAG TPA: isoprenylcysteine carboxylmethyltransferase family protein [Chthoniobacterales bacterium]
MSTPDASASAWREPLRHTRYFRLRGFFGGILLLPALGLVSVSYPIVQPDTPWDEVVESIGWVLFVLYVTCRLWATLYVGGRKDNELQTTGIYSVTRNPLYLGSTCFGLSAAFFLKSPLVLVLCIVALAFYLLKVIPTEEAVLRDRFGSAFDNYMAQTPRFFPRFAAYRPAGDVFVDLSAFKREARRLWGAALLPIVADLLEALRTSAYWPHLFKWL